MTVLETMGQKAKEAARILKAAGEQKNRALVCGAQALRDGTPNILEANKLDMKQSRETGLSPSLLDRLRLDEERLEAMAQAMEEISREIDPVGRVLSGETRPNGLRIEKITTPLGVAGIIYEARPNVTSDAASLCLKAGNAVILRGGKEAFHSNNAITQALRRGFLQAGLPEDCVQLVQDTSRESATEMMGLTRYLDVLIPRGGAGLIRAVTENSKVPVIETGVGNCHIYVDKDADLSMAVDIVFNAKTTRPSVCNAAETLLIHGAVAEKVLPLIGQKLQEKKVELRGCERTQKIVPQCIPALEEDWSTEYLDFVLAVKVVDSFEQAAAHIARYSTGHSEAIITENYQRAERFLQEIDSAAVYVNASTRFTDGGEFGLGAEIGISTQKLHARGPMGLSALTSYKFLIRGNGQIR